MSDDARTTPRLAQLVRLVRIALHFALGVGIAAVVLPFSSTRFRDSVIRWWSRKLLSVLQVRVEVKGLPPPDDLRSAVFVANHISWLDIWLIYSIHACRFVAKSEVRSWPFIGWMAEKVGTLFIERKRKRQTASLNEQMVAVLGAGACIAMFPEGTTTDGRQMRRFFGALLQPAAETGAPLIPTAIRYIGPDGQTDLTPAYIDDMSLAESLRRILAKRKIHAELTFLPAIESTGKTRRAIAQAAQEAISTSLNLPVLDRRPETARGPRSASPTDDHPTDSPYQARSNRS
jgi:1-acyl-sn-glycerol-3-phosphate acyltransferase